jgi:hypothetical protein
VTSTREDDPPRHRREYLPRRDGVEAQINDDLHREQRRQGQLGGCGPPLVAMRVRVLVVAIGNCCQVVSGRWGLETIVNGGSGFGSCVGVCHGVPVRKAVPDLREEKGQTKNKRQIRREGTGTAEPAHRAKIPPSGGIVDAPPPVARREARWRSHRDPRHRGAGAGEPGAGRGRLPAETTSGRRSRRDLARPWPP